MATRTRLVIFLIVVILATPLTAFAQGGECPPGSLPVGGLHGVYPDDLKVCIGAGGYHTDIDIGYDILDELPCDNWLELSQEVIVGDEGRAYISLVPTSSTLAHEARVRFLYMSQFFYFAPGPNDIDYITFELFDASNYRVAVEVHTVDSYPYIPSSTDSFPNLYFNMYLVDEIITTPLTFDPGGYIRVIIHRPAFAFETRFPIGTRGRSAIVSIQADTTEDTNFPDHCPFHNTVWPTVTPQPTPTNNPTLTPTPTGPFVPPTLTPTLTPRPTSAGGTVTVWPTSTSEPIIFPTTAAEWTPTPWPPYQLPTVAWPTIPTSEVIFPTTEPATPAPTVANPGGDTSSFATVAAQWGGIMEYGDVAASTTMTDSTGIAPPVVIANDMIQKISLPISYGKALLQFMPNAAPYLVSIMVLAGWVLFVHNSGFFMAVGGMVVNLLRWLWDLLPFT